MKILMLGNSFTYFHDMPKMLGALLNEEVDSVTRGGAYLYQMLDEQDELHTQVMEAINAEAELFSKRLRSPEATEAFQAFFQKRKPDFSKF